MAEYIHGSSDEAEVLRLERQARFAAGWILARFPARPEDRVLDLATGVGAMAQELAARFPGIQLVGLDLRHAQLLWAHRRHPVAAYVQGDAARMPFPSESFDLVHCSWLLEHVPRPVEVLREVRRVLRPQGLCQFTEVDNASFRVEPKDELVQEVMDALNEAQRRGGGDPFVGRRLEALFREAGFSRCEVWPAPLRGSSADPAFFQAFAEEFAEIFEGLDEALGPTLGPKLREAAARLRALPSRPSASMEYRGFIGQAWR